jgi:hypothetical protein
MAPILKQLVISSKSNPINRDLYTVVEMQGAISFDTATKTDIRVGDTISFQEVSDYLNSQQVDVQVTVRL